MDHYTNIPYPKQVKNGLKNAHFEHILRGSDLGKNGSFFNGFFSNFKYHVRFLRCFHLIYMLTCLPNEKIDKRAEKYKFDSSEILL